MKKTILIITLLMCIFTPTQITKAQNAETVFEEVEYMKVEPGMGADYLKTEAVWKKIHENRIASGEILYWALFVRMYPSGTTASYDYITVTGYKNAAALALKDNATVEAWTKGLTKEETDIAVNAEKTRKLVSRELDAKLLQTANNPAAIYIQSRYVKVAGNNQAEYEKIITSLKPVAEESIKNGNASSWEFFKTVFPTGQSMYDYTVCYDYTSLADALKNMGALPNYSAAYKKIYPNGDWTAVQKRITEIRQVVGTELWKKVDGTK